MTTTRLAEILGIEVWPEAYNVVFERFSAEWNEIKSKPLLDTELLEQLVEEGFIAREGVRDLLACLELVKADEELSFALQWKLSFSV